MPEPTPRRVIVYTSEDDKSPYKEWIEGLRDRRAVARIGVRIDRLSLGLFGDRKTLTNAAGVCELRLNFGPGYRIYFAEKGDTIVVLLCGGDKGSQDRDISRAIVYWEDFKRRDDG